MSEFLNTEQINKAAANIIVQRATDLFFNSVGGIYKSEGNRKPEFEGSCVFIEFKKRKYFLTAAHVLDKISENRCFICGPNDFDQYTGQVVSHSSEDKFDVAIGTVSNDFISKNPSTNYVDVTNLKRDFSQYNHHRFLIMGLPKKKNKKPMPGNQISPPVKWGFVAPSAANADIISSTNRTWQTHLFMKWDHKSALSPEFKEITPFNLKGMSGGAIIDLGSLADVNILVSPEKIVPRLVGIFTDHRMKDKLVFGTKLATIISSYDSWNQWPK